MKREASLKQEQDKNHLLSLQDEYKRIRTQFEESIANHEKEIKDLNDYLEDLRQQKESGIRECNELKTQLKMVEDMRDNARRDLLDSNRRIRELEEAVELQRKEINDLKRYLNDEVNCNFLPNLHIQLFL